MRTLFLAMCSLMATSLCAQLPFSFSGTAGDACAPAQDPFIQTWPGTADPAGSVRFAWSVTNTEATAVQLEVQVVRDQFGTPPATVFPASTVHSFNVIVAPNTTTTGEAFWTCAPLSFEQGLAHSVRVFGPAGTCTAFSITVEESLGVFQNDPEPNNSSGQFTVLAAGVYQEGRMNRNNVSDQDWYRLQIPENGTLRIEFEGEQPSATTTFEMQFQLSFTNGTVLSTNTVPLGANRVPVSSVIEIPCRGSGGVYNLRLTNGGACDISYRFRYVVVAPVFGNDPEPNNGIGGSATLVGFDTQRVGQLNHDFDGNIDVFRIDPPFNGVLSIDVEAEHSGSAPSNLQVLLQNSAGTVLASWTPAVGTNGNVITSELNYNCLGNTVFYYLSFSSSACGTSYRWKYTVDQPVFGNDVEPNQSTSQAILLPLATAREGQINFFAGFNDNTDFYRIDMPGNGTLNLTVEAEHVGASTTETLQAQVTFSTGTELATWSAPIGAGSQASSTSFSLPCLGATQPLFIRLQSSTCGTSYRVSWTYSAPVYANDVEPNNSVGSGTDINLNASAQDGQIGFGPTTDADVYHFTHPGGPWSVSVNAEHPRAGSGTMTLDLYNNFTLLQTYTVNVGGSSTALLNTFSLPNLNAGTLYRLRFAPVTCGVSYRILCYDDDNDGVCNGADLCPGTPTGEGVNSNGCSCSQLTVDDGDPCTLDECTNGVVSNTFQDADNDGTCDALDGCPNDPNKTAPGTCGCGNPEPGTTCDDNNPNTGNDVIQANCLCAGTPIDCNGDIGGTAFLDNCNTCVGGNTGLNPCAADCNGDFGGTAFIDNCNTCVGGNTGLSPCVADCNGDFGGTAFIDNCNTCVGGNTGLNACVQDCNGDFGGTAFIDNCNTCVGGNTGLNACVQDCNGDFGGTAVIDDCNTCVGGNTGLSPCTADCNGDFGGTAFIDDCNTCVGGNTGLTPCVPGLGTAVVLELRTDNTYDQVSWEIRNTANMVICSGSGYSALTTTAITEVCDLPDGCYTLRVEDAAGDGFGSNGGYQLRLAGSDPQDVRIIENLGNFTDGFVSEIANGPSTFCVPFPADPKPIFSLRDKEDFTAGQYFVSDEVAAVSALWIDGAPNSAQSSNTGYQFWFFDPNGSFNFRRFRSHRGSDGYANVGATRACHMKINNWDAAFHIPENVLMNVRIRTRINGVGGEWGPAYRFKIDPVAAACPETKLLDFPGNPNISCGQTRAFGPGNFVYARPVTGANRYQFRFRIADEGYTRVRESNNYILPLNWNFQPLEAGKTYDVDVRVSKDGGATWCASGSQWGDNCTLTITGSGAQGATQNLALGQGEGTLTMWPNPNRSEQLWIDLSGIEQGVGTVAIDIFDLAGKRLVAREIATSYPSAQDGGRSYTVLDLNGELAAGTYLVTITAGEQRYTERLVIAN